MSAPPVRSVVRRHPVVVCLVLAFALSWGAWAPAVAAGRPLDATGYWWLGGLGPGVAGLVVAWTVAGRTGIRALGRRLVRWRVGLLPWAFAVTFPAWGLGVVAVATLFDGGNVTATLPVGVDPSLGARAPAALRPLAPVAFVLVVGVSGELGWRGVVLPALQRSYSPLASSVLLALGWTAWHLPLLVVAGVGAPVAWLGLHLLALSLLSTWLSNRTGGSLLVTVVFHALLVATGWLFPGLLGRDLGTAGFATGVVLATVVAALVAFAPSGFDDPPQRRRRGRAGRQSTEWL